MNDKNNTNVDKVVYWFRFLAKKKLLFINRGEQADNQMSSAEIL